MKICYAAIALPERAGMQASDSKNRHAAKASYVALDPFPVRAHTRRSISPTWIIAFTVFDQPVNWQRPYQREAKPTHRDWAGQVWVPLAQELLEKGAIQGHEIEMRQGGLARVAEGLQDVLMGKVGGRKLVYAV